MNVINPENMNPDSKLCTWNVLRLILYLLAVLKRFKGRREKDPHRFPGAEDVLPIMDLEVEL